MFKVSRIKVEVMIIDNNYDKLSLENNKSLYWEFHIKIIVKKYEDLIKLFLYLQMN